MNRSWQQAKLIADAVKAGQVETGGKSLAVEAARAGYGVTPDEIASYAKAVLEQPAGHDYGVVERAWAYRNMSPT